jgi:hypothetical protein
MTLIELVPEYNPFSQKWEVRETDERDNEIETHSFDSSAEADAFVDQWIETRDNRSAGLW